MKYKSVIATKIGGPETLQIIENDLRPPEKDEVRIKVQAASVCRPDIALRRGSGLYSGTPLGYKMPCIPGYSVIGFVDAVGENVYDVSIGDRVGALTVVGGYTEYLYWKHDRLIPIPSDINAGDAVPIILNYIVAYQVLRRKAKVQAGESALLFGASGGLGTAFLQLGKLAGLKIYGLASANKHDVLLENGATPIDYRTQNFTEVLRALQPDGIDIILDGMMQYDNIKSALELLKPGGRFVGFGDPSTFKNLFAILGKMMATNLMPNRKSFSVYGTSAYFVGNKQPFIEDWQTLFNLFADKKIKPVIQEKFPILDAANANALLESGHVTGNVVLVAPEYL